MKSIRGTLLPILWLAASLSLLACSADDVADGRSVLHRGLSTDPESLDPQKARSVQAADVLRDIGEGLTGYSASGQLIPGAAESWQVSEDGLTYTFTIRADARWSDGEPLSASHFVTGLRRLVDPTVAAFYANTITDIENAAAIIAGDAAVTSLGVNAPDDRTLRIKLSRPVPYMLGLLTHPSTFPATLTAG